MMRALLLTFAVVGAALAPANAQKNRAPAARVTGELGLERAISIALKQNPDLLRAIKEIERTRGQVVEVRAQALPRVALNANYFQQDKDLIERSSRSGGNSLSVAGLDFGDTFDDFSTGDKTWRVTFEAKQLIYSGGQVGAALKIARFTEDQSYWVMRDTVDRVISRVRAQFYTVLLNRKLITVAEESIRLLGDELKDQRNRFDAGTVPKFNVLRAEVAVANAQPDLIRAKNNHLIAQLELAKTLGLDTSTRPDGKPTFEVVGELRARERGISLQRALAVARQRRASLKAQKQTILTEEQQITVAAAGSKPRIEANTGWEFRNSRRTDDLSKEANGWYFGINGTWNVFDGYETKGKIAQAKARLGSAEIAYADSVQQVELEVQKAHAGVREAKELIASQIKVVEQADEALRLARERLAAGAGTQLEVLDAQVALTKARTTQQQALADYNIALAELDRATGADTMYDDTFNDPRAARAKTKLRGGAELREEE
jgi:outer membrane protein